MSSNRKTTLGENHVERVYNQLKGEASNEPFSFSLFWYSSSPETLAVRSCWRHLFYAFRVLFSSRGASSHVFFLTESTKMVQFEMKMEFLSWSWSAAGSHGSCLCKWAPRWASCTTTRWQFFRTLGSNRDDIGPGALRLVLEPFSHQLDWGL